ncbi:uncharacterized protein LOC101850498 [Aplysia californica]|uniref:Uncharacterized protein LOC101850498 n=1 Tax=Aplysia californica TaxID=6500 RepID=A0ABM0JYR8_APLCA|nr:uncharacterized protein LOC101850498 [Aplysia californica]
MKFPINVIAKKPAGRRQLLKEENLRNNNLNTIRSETTNSNSSENSNLLLAPQSQQPESPLAVINNRPNDQPTEQASVQTSECPLVGKVCEVNNNVLEDEGVEEDAEDENGNSIAGVDSFCRESERIPSVDLSSQCGDESGFNSCSSDKECEYSSSNCDCPNEESDFVSSNVSMAPKPQSPHRVLSDSALTLLPSKTPLKSTVSDESINCDDQAARPVRRSKNIVRVHGASIDSLPSARCTRTSRSRRSERSASSSDAQPGGSRRRRRTRHDHNNNDLDSKSLHSYLYGAPFKMQDCFQKKGFLTFISCIVYTLFLVVVFTVLGALLSACKALIRNDELQDIKRNVLQARRTRTPSASG